MTGQQVFGTFWVTCIWPHYLGLIFKIFGYRLLSTYKSRSLLTSSTTRQVGQLIFDLPVHNHLAGLIFCLCCLYIVLFQISRLLCISLLVILKRSYDLGHEIGHQFRTLAFCISLNSLQEFSLSFTVEIVVTGRDFTIPMCVVCALEASNLFDLVHMRVVQTSLDYFRVHELLAR